MISKSAILARKRINEILEENGGSWRLVEKKLKISRGTLYHIQHGDRPPSNKVLAALGLPLEHITVSPCPKCGQLHEFRKRCPSAPIKRRKRYDISLAKLRELMQSPYSNS